MKKVLLFSLLLLAGLLGSQMLPWVQEGAPREVIRLLTVVCLGFIMIHVGYEFEIDKSRLRSYGADYLIAATAAAFPWIFCAAWFLLMVEPRPSWEEALLAGRFAAPTSAGILFAMLAAAGLSATWLFRKARILAIFDDLDTVLLMIPLKMLIVGMRWPLAALVLIMAVLLWLAWSKFRSIRLPVTWSWVLAYSVLIVATTEGAHLLSKLLDDTVSVHIEVLLPAFVVGCLLMRPKGSDPHCDDAREGHQEGPEDPAEQRVSTLISAAFMVLVGLSMPKIAVGGDSGTSVGGLLGHTIMLTILGNLGKMFPLFCYRGEASWRERLALCIGMWPRGEVGAGVLIVSIGYGIGGTMVASATLALALNLLLTGLFIYWVKRLLSSSRPAAGGADPAADSDPSPARR